MKLTIENAHQLLEEAKYDEAKEVFLDLHEANPSDARVNYGLGVVYDHENEIPLAVKHLQAAALVATKKGIVFTKLADALRKDNDLESALEAARKGAALDKKSSMAQIVLGECYDSLLRPVMARTCFENAVKLAPNLADGYIRLARHLATFGKFDDARAILSKAKEIDTTSADILILQFDLDNHENIKGILEKSKKIISKYSSETSNETAGILAFRIAKFHEKLKETDKAFEFYDQNRKLLYKDYEIERRKRQLTAYKQVFTKDFFSSREEASLGSDKPVFVFGMPRSGTTLAEQIIAQHKFANGVGECTYFTQLQKQLFKGSTYSSNIFNEISKFRAKDFKKIGNTYVKTITRDDKKSRRIVDKMPHNFEMLWMIALLFPNAHFIHMKRNPGDNCSSIYTTSLNSAHSYNIDQRTLGKYYRLYEELMDHWKEILPVTIYEQSYEDLVSDQEAESRKLIDHLGLDWDPACLEFYKSSNQVFTASQSQVRQPIYTSSRGRWKKYEPHIQPLLEELGMV